MSGKPVRPHDLLDELIERLGKLTEGDGRKSFEFSTQRQGRDNWTVQTRVTVNREGEPGKAFVIEISEIP